LPIKNKGENQKITKFKKNKKKLKLKKNKKKLLTPPLHYQSVPVASPEIRRSGSSTLI